MARDIDGTGYDFEDAEVEYAYAAAGSVKGAAALLLGVLANDSAKVAVRADRLGVVDDLRSVAGALAARSQQLAAEAASEDAAGVMVSVVTPSWTGRGYRRNVALNGLSVTDYTQKKVAP